MRRKRAHAEWNRLRRIEHSNTPPAVVLTTDSQYVMKGVREWMPNWKKRNWQTASKQPVKNVDLWQQLDALVSQHEIEWRWVRGHTGHPENELADQLANLGVEHVLKERKG